MSSDEPFGMSTEGDLLPLTGDLERDALFIGDRLLLLLRADDGDREREGECERGMLF